MTNEIEPGEKYPLKNGDQIEIKEGRSKSNEYSRESMDGRLYNMAGQAQDGSHFDVDWAKVKVGKND